MNKIYLAGGCFWCIGDYFKRFNGVKDVVVGYSGGIEKDITYKEVKSQNTKHRETIEVHYDETKISVNELLDIYFSYVDIYDSEGQYIDKGYSYTLALYYQNIDEYNLFTNRVKELEQQNDKPIFINVEPFKFFVKAEDYHQDYSSKNPESFLDELKTSHRTCHLKLLNIK